MAELRRGGVFRLRGAGVGWLMAAPSKATARPWTRSVFMVYARDGADKITNGIINAFVIDDPNVVMVAQTGYSSSLGPSRSDEAEANAALIVKAVNLHDELVAVLTEVRDDLAEKIECDLDLACLHDDAGNYLRETIDEISRPRIEEDEALFDRIKLTLAKAGAP